MSIPKPTFCIINAYPVCMFKCKMCYIRTLKNVPILAFTKIKEFIDSLADLTQRKIEINFTGGEVLLRNDISDLINVAHRHGIRTSLCTNGYLIDEKIAKRLVDSGLNGMVISLDSLKAETHDTLRGITGSYDKIMQALDYLGKFASEEFKISIQALITGLNLDSIVELANWVQRNGKISGISYMAITEPLYIPDGTDWYKKDPYKSLWPQDIGEVNAAIDELIRLKAQGGPSKIINLVSQLKAFKSYFEDPERFLKKISCGLGLYALNVNYTGDVSPCFSLGTIGNIYEENIKDMWYSKRAEELREKMKRCRNNCNYLVNCYKEETYDESELRL